jgi:hypothetical protein
VFPELYIFEYGLILFDIKDLSIFMENLHNSFEETSANT